MIDERMISNVKTHEISLRGAGPPDAPNRDRAHGHEIAYCAYRASFPLTALLFLMQQGVRCLVFLGQWWKEYCFER